MAVSDKELDYAYGWSNDQKDTNSERWVKGDVKCNCKECPKAVILWGCFFRCFLENEVTLLVTQQIWPGKTLTRFFDKRGPSALSCVSIGYWASWRNFPICGSVRQASFLYVSSEKHGHLLVSFLIWFWELLAVRCGCLFFASKYLRKCGCLNASFTHELR